MRKPSIFSRDYERIMKRRKIIFIITVIVVVIIAGYGGIKLLAKGLNSSGLEDKLQAWVSEDQVQDSDENKVEDMEQNKQEDLNQEKDLDTEENTKNDKMEIVINNEKIVVEYEKKDGENYFKNIDKNEGNLTIDISPSKKRLLVEDKKQNLKVYDVNKKEENITMNEYNYKDIETFYKENTLETYPGYLWHSSPKFANDNIVVYVSNMPYFGLNNNQYLWTYNFDTKSHSCIWGVEGKEIKIGNIEEKGLEISIDGNIKYIDKSGKLVQ